MDDFEIEHECMKDEVEKTITDAVTDAVNVLGEMHRYQIDCMYEELEYYRDMTASLQHHVIQLYLAGKWELPTSELTEEQQAKLWENVRNWAGIDEGTATEHGVGA